MDALLLQFLNGLDKGGAYALIALGLTLTFGTLGVVNFAHGALFMLGAFCAVVTARLLSFESVTEHPTELTPWGTPVEIRTTYMEMWFGDVGAWMVDHAVFISVLVVIPVMLLIGIAMERGLIRYFYRRPHAEQILVTFGLAIVLAELVKAWFGANPIPVSAPAAFAGSANIAEWFGLDAMISYPWWRLIYLVSALVIIAAVFAFLNLTTYGMVVRAGMADRETVQLLGIAAIVAGLAGALYTPILPPNYHIGMDFLVLSFVVVVVGGMGSLGGAVLAGFLLGIIQSFASLTEVKSILPGIDQIIIYLVAVVVLLARPRGLLGRKGVMEA
jgi:branched-chain amino acid transport system permease protein